MRSIRYQGAIIQEHHVLLLKQLEYASGRSYWQIPGGGIAPGETEEQCVEREILEETGLSVQVDALLLGELLDDPKTRDVAGRVPTGIAHRSLRPKQAASP